MTLKVDHPGVFLKQKIRDKNWSQRDLGYVLNTYEQTISLIINGKKGISPDMAKSLGIALDVPAEKFIRLQVLYDLSQAKEPSPEKRRKELSKKELRIRDTIGKIQKNYKSLEKMADIIAKKTMGVQILASYTEKIRAGSTTVKAADYAIAEWKFSMLKKAAKTDTL